MTDHLEQRLRDLFADDASRAPRATALVTGAVRRARQRRRTELTWAAGCAGALVVAVVVLSAGLPDQQPGTASTALSSPATSSGPFPGDASASCAFTYSARTLAERAFAFDGTVTSIGPARTNRGGAESGYVSVTFTVHEWFRGGSGPTVSVDMNPPTELTGTVVDEWGPSYGVGTRLLVSGMPRWGGAPLDDAVAWTCGFTRYYDEADASTWRIAFK